MKVRTATTVETLVTATTARTSETEKMASRGRSFSRPPFDYFWTSMIFTLEPAFSSGGFCTTTISPGFSPDSICVNSEAT